jgi:hypothetical protein
MVNYLLEMDSDFGILAVPVIGGVMDELRYLVKPQLCRNG